MVTSLGGSGIPCHKLSPDSFKNYGHVVQSYSSAAEAPKGIATFEAPDGKIIKFHEVAPVRNTYAVEAGASTGISVFRCTVKPGMQQGKPWPIHFMERHPHTDQAFIPMGISSVSNADSFGQSLR
jgi:allantoicase